MRRLLILGMALSFSAAWAKKTEDEHWKDIGLPFATAEKILNETECYASDLEFFACARAMNALASSASMELTGVKSFFSCINELPILG